MDFKQRYLRLTRKTSDCLPLAWGMSILALFVGAIILGIILRHWDVPVFDADPTADVGHPAPLIVLGMYATSAGIWIGVMLFVSIAQRDHRMLKALAPNKRGNTGKWVLIGLALGFGCNALCVAVSAATGIIDLSFSVFEPHWLLLIFLAVFIQSGAEELLTRVYLYQKLRRRYKSPAVAIVGSTVFFTVLHFGNPGLSIWGVTEIAVIGLLLALFVYYFDSIWAAMAMHTAWNYTQNILFGLPNSGIVSQYSLFKLDAATSGFFFDPAFGVEGSPGACLIILAVCVAVCLVARKRNEPREDLWAEEERALEMQAQTAATQLSEAASRL